MKRAIAITSVLLLALTVSCREATDTTAPTDPGNDADKTIPLASPEEMLTNIDNARRSADPARLRKVLKTATTRPNMPPELVKKWTRELEKLQIHTDYKEITELLIDEKFESALARLDAFIKKYPENKRAKIIRDAVKKKLAMDATDRKACRLFDNEKWDQALPLLKKLRAQNRGNRRFRYMLRECEYELALIEFNKAVKADDLDKAVAAGRKARDISPDRYESDIEPKILTMQTLDKGAAALRKGQYSETRKIVDHLKDTHPEAADLIRRSKHREQLARGNLAASKGEHAVALAHYKIAKNYAKTPAEHKMIDALIKAVQAGG